jgi:hypothetical protein
MTLPVWAKEDVIIITTMRRADTRFMVFELFRVNVCSGVKDNEKRQTRCELRGAGCGEIRKKVARYGVRGNPVKGCEVRGAGKTQNERYEFH